MPRLGGSRSWYAGSAGSSSGSGLPSALKRGAEGSISGDPVRPRKRAQGELRQTAAPPNCSFAASNKRAQQRTQYLEAESSYLVREIAEALEWAKCHCMACHITGEEGAPRHGIGECPVIREASSFGQLFDDWRDAIDYTWHSSICFSCHVPVMGHLHRGGLTTKTTDNCGDDKDIIWLAVWMILHTRDVKADAEHSFHSKWPSMSAFNAWNNDREVVGAYGTGLVALLVWYHRGYCS